MTQQIVRGNVLCCVCWPVSLSPRLFSVPIHYPPGLEQMVDSFKPCATARLFLQVTTGPTVRPCTVWLSQDMLPEVDAGIFLDLDTLLLEDLGQLWDRSI